MNGVIKTDTADSTGRLSPVMSEAGKSFTMEQNFPPPGPGPAVQLNGSTPSANQENVQVRHQINIIEVIIYTIQLAPLASLGSRTSDLAVQIHVCMFLFLFINQLINHDCLSFISPVIYSFDLSLLNFIDCLFDSFIHSSIRLFPNLCIS